MHGLRRGVLVGICSVVWLSIADDIVLTESSQAGFPMLRGPKEPELPVDSEFSLVPLAKEFAQQTRTPTNLSVPVHDNDFPRQVERSDMPGETISIDTMDLDQPEGNWLNKRIWWERAQGKYKECRDVFETIFASRMTFLEKRSDVEKTTLDPFYREIGLEQGELREILIQLIEYVDEEKAETGALDEKARAFRDKVAIAKKDIEQLKLDIDAISDIDGAIDNAVNALSNKINEAHRFEQAAWSEFESIAHELSDKRARERFYVIDGIHKNLKDLQNYIAGEFTAYFTGLVQASLDKTERAKKEVKELKDQGIDLQEQAKMLVSDEEVAADEAQRAARVVEEARKAAEAAKVGLFGRAWAWFVGALKSFWNMLFGKWLYRF